MRNRITVFLFAGVLWLCSAGSGFAGITTEPRVPAEGEAAVIHVTGTDDAPVAGVPVDAVYRPGSNIEREVRVGTTGADGSLSWTPDGAGLVALTADPDGEAQTQNLSVKFSGLPLSGLVILLAAGIILYGGIIRGFRSLTTLPARLPPDT